MYVCMYVCIEQFVSLHFKYLTMLEAHLKTKIIKNLKFENPTTSVVKNGCF